MQKQSIECDLGRKESPDHGDELDHYTLATGEQQLFSIKYDIIIVVF
jgi:hypothetical protein